MKHLMFGKGCLALLSVFVFICVGCSEQNYDADSKAYVDKVAPVIFKDWDTTMILQEADADLKNFAQQNPDQFKAGIQSMKDSVGSMKAYKGCTELDKAKENPDKTVTVSYSVDADFEKGTSKITLLTTFRDGKWQMGLFNLDPQAELKRVMQTVTPNP